MKKLFKNKKREVIGLTTPQVLYKDIKKRSYLVMKIF